MAEKRIEYLLRNRWEKYDEARMRNKKALVLVLVSVFLWLVMFLVVGALFDHSSMEKRAASATALVVLILLFILFKLRQMDVKKTGWYFSALQDMRLRRDEVLELIRVFLKESGYAFTEEETHRTMTLWITYFTIPSVDFKIRVWFTSIGGMPTAEIGVGPETAVNKATLERIREEISNRFMDKYGGPADTR